MTAQDRGRLSFSVEGHVAVFQNGADLRARKADWIDIDDYEIFILGGSDIVATGDETPEPIPDPVTDGQGVMKFNAKRPGGRILKPKYPKERIVVLSGRVTYENAGSRVLIERLGFMDIPPEGAVIRNAQAQWNGKNTGTGGVFTSGNRTHTEVLRIAGHWKQSDWMGLFSFGPNAPCDVHYHDADEYWFVHRGHYKILVDGVEEDMGPGTFLAAGMGIEHGVANPTEVFEGIGFGTQLEGQKRPGHLWRAVHGTPVPTRGAATKAR
jgi:mannose-6-phosphate isomerase-like protein (cupin superfamily)